MITFKLYVCSPARYLPQQSSSSGDLPPEMMESEMPPQAFSPLRADDLEVSSRRISPDHPAARGTMKTTPEGDTSIVKGPGEAAPTGTNNEGPELSDLQPKTILGSSKHTLLKGVCTPAAASGNPEVLDTLMGTLQRASISEEHRTLMGTVVERILSARSGLNEAFMSLLRGFEVCHVISSIALLRAKCTCV